MEGMMSLSCQSSLLAAFLVSHVEVVLNRNIPSSWEHFGDGWRACTSVLGRVTDGQQVELRCFSKEAHPGTSFFPWISTKVETNKCWESESSRQLMASIIYHWSQTWSDWRLLLSDSFCLANARWAVRRGLLLKEWIMSEKSIGARCRSCYGCQEGSFN